MQTTKLTRVLVAGGAIAALSASYLAGRQHWQATMVTPAVAAAASATTSQPAARMMVPDFSSIVQHYGPAVVNISAVHDASAASQSNTVQMPPGMNQNDPFYQFFRQFYGGLQQQPQNSQPSEDLGSGFIVSPNGYILTNAHVVDGAQHVTVKLTDKREYKAKVVGSDKASDVALLKINATGLPTVKIGNPADTKVGQWVLAIGSPYGFDNTVTSGIVSAKSRSLPDENYVPFIQTDVPVNPGNSGGPLFNLNGEVIGINSMIYTRTGGFQGLSFAIPIDLAMKVKTQLQQYGKVTRGRLGVAIQEVSQPLAKSFGLSSPTGALVSSIDKTGPAAKSGLKPGDVILAVNGNKVDDSTQLPAMIADMRPGDTADLLVWHDGAKHHVSVKLGSYNGTELASNGSGQTTHTKLGVSVRSLTPNEMSEAQVTHGLLVERSSGPAEQAGVQAGDIILSIDGTPVRSAAQLSAKIKTAGENVALLIQREGQQIFIPVDLGLG
ncbi:MAG: DegQ family serine endoprotease [Burkholderiales bacterium]|nr:DegQ family serine endoprotease [Burkholderiales bacterium]MDE2610254.1 DegQ family serine endoprotease [Burkholderiales bacterium]